MQSDKINSPVAAVRAAIVADHRAKWMTEDEINLAWSHSIAELIADALVAGKVIAKTEYERAREIIAEEVLARLCVHDRPDQTNPRYKSN